MNEKLLQLIDKLEYNAFQAGSIEKSHALRMVISLISDEDFFKEMWDAVMEDEEGE